MARASAPTWRTAEPHSSTERLPEVTPSFGLAAVVTGRRRTLESTSSSSAAICAKAVRMPWPISILPGEARQSCRREPQPSRQARIGARLNRELGGHGSSAWAARSTARTIRLWAPHRHRFRSSALRTSASLGSGFARAGPPPTSGCLRCNSRIASPVPREKARCKGGAARGSEPLDGRTPCRRRPRGRSQAATAWPSTMTLQAPHWLTPQPNACR